ncbi:glycosyltransferase [Limisalsivibrio acetivorans]|uniref:glycosyltransferase n=1 Tax=Limisalsivibrio acetivorans TaxID=1304888 RepID=UPI0003B44E32|nr:glycosyltransferase [Limisalsivibrio acetivorans]
MKVAFIVGGLPFGGIENSLLDLTRHFKDDRRVDAYVINISGTGMRVPDFEEAGIKLINVCSSLSAIKSFRITTVFKVRRVLKDIDPDIIHTIHFTGDYFGRLASIGLDKPVITHIRNTKREKKLHRRLSNRFLSRYTTKYLSVSQMVKDYVEEAHNVAKKPSEVLYNFFDPSKKSFAPLKREDYIPEGRRALISVSRLVPQKNIDKVIRAVDLVRKRYPDIHCLIVGEGGQRKKLELLASELGLKGNVTFLGYRKDVPALLSLADMFVFPSEFEGFGTAHLEAMFMGLPAIISEDVPTKEFAGDSSIICDRTPEALAECIIRVLSDDELYGRMRESALAISAEFTLESYADKLVSIYEDLLQMCSFDTVEK